MMTQELGNEQVGTDTGAEGSGGSVPIPSTPSPSPAPTPSLRETLSAEFDKAAAEPTPSPSQAPAPTPAPATSQVTPADEAALAKAALENRPIPARLREKFEKNWTTLDPTVREAFHAYETDIGRMADKYGKSAKSWERAMQTFEPYRQMVEGEGGTFDTALANLFETARILRQGTPEQKLGMLNAMRQAFNIPPDSGAPTAAPGQAPTPAVGQLSPELLDRIHRLELQHLTSQASSNYNLRQQVDEELSAFVASPENTYVKEPGFLDTMAALISAGKAEDLADAYKQAAWLHDGPRSMEIAKINAAQASTQREAAERAQRASISVNGNAPGTVRRDPSKMTLRDTLEAAFDGDLP